jgi:HEAT repeat protein
MVRRQARAVLVALVLVGTEAGAFVWPSTVDRVIHDLADANPVVRRRAARRLFELSPGVVKRVALPALDDSDVEVRVGALEALMEARARGLGARATVWLGDGDARVRRAAAVALARDPSKDAVPALGRVLSDPESSVRVAAAKALGASGTRAAVVPLLGRLDDSDPEVREAVVRSLSRLGDPGSVVPLAGKIQDTRPSVRRTVATALGVLGDARASGPLLLLLRDSEESVRAAALQALGRIRASDAVATIVSLLGDERRPAVREAAYTALSEIPSDAGIDALVDCLSRDDPRERSPVRAALARAGDRAVPKLILCLRGQPSPDLADGCALTLGEMKAGVAASAVDAALRRGVVRPQAALRALGASGDGRALVTVLEQLSADDPWVRRVAVEAAAALLDPTEPDGRAVEPIVRALDAAHGRRSERIALANLLGRTGSPRAASTLAEMARDVVDPALRFAALQALGFLGRAGQDAVLLDALHDPQPRIRLAAALSLKDVGSAQSEGTLLDRVENAAEEDRRAILIALSGPLSVTTDGAVLAHASRLLSASDGAERDLMVEALGAAPGARGSTPLAALVPAADVATRAKVAEALGAHPEALPALRALTRDSDSSVRANAVWALGSAGTTDDAKILTMILRDRDPAVAGNAAAALGRLGARGAAVTEILCHAAEDDRAYVRANALSGLAVARARCASSVEREALAFDPSEIVRAAAARLLSTVHLGDSAVDRSALERCVAEDPSGVVSAACAAQAQGVSQHTLNISVYVVPVGATEPIPRMPFALVRPDGLLRLGVSDRRGVVTEHDAPRGTIRLEVPAPLAQ